jgi:hypothetical protein
LPKTSDHSWDIWNEPDNRNGNDYAKQDPPNKIELVNKLLPLAFNGRVPRVRRSR